MVLEEESVPMDDRMIYVENVLNGTLETLRSKNVESVSAVATVLLEDGSVETYTHHAGRDGAVVIALTQALISHLEELAEGGIPSLLPHVAVLEMLKHSFLDAGYGEEGDHA